MESEGRDYLGCGLGEWEETRKIKKVLYLINLYQVWEMLCAVGRKVNLLVTVPESFGSWCLR